MSRNPQSTEPNGYFGRLLQNIVATRDSDQAGSYLGRLCWYTIPEAISVSRSDLEREFQKAGLREGWLPRPIRPSDAFRRASALLQRKNIEVVKDEVYANVLVREVSSNREEIERHIIWETVDSTEKHLSYRQVATLRLEKAGDTVTANTELGVSSEVAQGCDGFGESFSRCLENYDGNGVRKCVGEIVHQLMATVVRPSGAVYFVPEKKAEDLGRMGSLIKNLGADYFEVPLVDARDTRDMVAKNFIRQTTEMIASLAEVLKDPGATKGKYLAALDQSKYLTEQVKEYRELLQINMSDLEGRIKLLSLQALSIVDKAQELKSAAC